MAITVNLYTFSKRENSTKRPSSGGTSYSCTLLDETSLMNPTFKLSIASNPIGKNYAYVPDFNRYYFINDIRSYQNFWYIDCTCDVLASFKDTIGAESHYVLRSASQYDEYISDPHYGAKVKRTAVILPQTGVLYWGTGHSYVLGVTGYAGDNTKQVGSVTYYHMDSTALYNFMYFLMHNIQDWCDIPTAQYDEGVQEALLNPIQYVVSCIALPVSPPGDGVNPAIHFGYYTCPALSLGSGHCRILTMGQTVTEQNTISIPKHSQATTRGKYMNGAPFTQYTFHLGPFGDIELDPADLIDASHIRYKVTYDMCSGAGRLVVGAAIDDTTNIANVAYCGGAQIGVQIQLSQAIIDPLKSQLSWETGLNNVMASGLSGGISLSTPSNLFRAQNALQETYADAIRNRYPNVLSKGNPGALINFFDNDYGCYLLAKFYTVVDENITEIGRPLCQTKRIDTLSGYILCENADAQIAGTQDESQKINGYLNSGFFYE